MPPLLKGSTHRRDPAFASRFNRLAIRLSKDRWEEYSMTELL
jgi:hypothetical protein